MEILTISPSMNGHQKVELMDELQLQHQIMQLHKQELIYQ